MLSFKHLKPACQAEAVIGGGPGQAYQHCGHVQNTKHPQNGLAFVFCNWSANRLDFSKTYGRWKLMTKKKMKFYTPLR